MFLPICVDTTHWILGDLDVTSIKMVVYDTYRVEALANRVKAALALFTMRFHALMKELRDVRLHASKKFSWTYASNVPQQCSPLGDYRIWVCTFISDLVKGQNPMPTINPTDEIEGWRMYMVEEFYRRAEIA